MTNKLFFLNTLNQLQAEQIIRRESSYKLMQSHSQPKMMKCQTVALLLLSLEATIILLLSFSPSLSLSLHLSHFLSLSLDLNAQAFSFVFWQAQSYLCSKLHLSSRVEWKWSKLSIICTIYSFCKSKNCFRAQLISWSSKMFNQELSLKISKKKTKNVPSDDPDSGFFLCSCIWKMKPQNPATCGK